jgi:competence protein ComEC
LAVLGRASRRERAGRRSAGRRLVVSAVVRAALEEVRARPRHVALASVVCGLLAGPRSAAGTLACAGIAVALAGRRPLALLAAGSVLAGALGAQLRLETLDRSALAPWVGHAVRIDATLVEPARLRPFGGREAVARVVRGPGRGERVLIRTRVSWPSAAVVGAVVDVRGGVRALGPHDGFWRIRNVHAVVAADTVRPTGRRRGGALGFVDRVRERGEAALAHGPPAPQAALLRGMVLGEDDALPDAMRDEFRTTGLSHLVAASGANVMLLAAVAVWLGVMTGMPLRARLVLVLGLIVLYVPLAGAGPSIQRAGVMGAAGVTASLVGRPSSRWYALLLAAAVTLLVNPRSAQDAGWQLSFAAVVAIFAVAGRFTERLRGRRVPAGLAEAVALTVAATAGTAPLLALRFGQLSAVSLPANVLVAPAVAPIMWLGALAAAIGQLSTAAAWPFAMLATAPLGFVSWVADAGASLPGASWAITAPGGAAVVGICAAAVLVLAGRRPGVRWRPGCQGCRGHRTCRGCRARRWAGVAVAGLVMAAAFGLAARHGAPVATPSGLRVTFLDVGQGDATLLQDRDAAMLVDAGPPDGPILARLRHAGVRRLDALVVTHAQADHEGGAAAVLHAVPVGLVLDGRDGVRSPDGTRLALAAQQRHVPLVVPDTGQVIRAGRLALRVLSPRREPARAHVGDDPNQRAIVAELVDGPSRVLLTADAESDVTAALPVGPVDLLKVAHHGSADAGLPALLSRVRPRLAVISVGRGNPYGHPAPQTVRALAGAVPHVLRTDRDGTVSVEVRSGGLVVRPHA